MPAPPGNGAASDQLHRLEERHEELLARIDDLNEQILDALKLVTGDSES